MQRKVEICGVNTAKLKVLKSSETQALLLRAKAGDAQAREELIAGNLRLVLSVIQRFANRGENADDLFQVGCIGLCKAVATDKGGTFSTYAYQLIWHEICDVLVKANKQKDTEVLEECEQNISEPDDGERKAEINFDVVRELMAAKAEAPPHVVKGIDAMVLMAKGYTCREIGERMGVSDNLVSAYVSKARKYLKGRPTSAAMMEIYAA